MLGKWLKSLRIQSRDFRNKKKKHICISTYLQPAYKKTKSKAQTQFQLSSVHSVKQNWKIGLTCLVGKNLEEESSGPF
jgi:hypothetical protein